SRGGGLSGRPHSAAVTAPGHHRRLCGVRRRASAHRRDALGAWFRTRQGALPRRVPARGAQGNGRAMNRDRLHLLLPLIGVIGLIALWYIAVWYRVVDPVLLPSP